MLSKEYEIQEILGQNLSGGRITYRARVISDNSSVVVKQFQFAKSSSNWSAYAELSSEINILKQLNHPGIPRYLNSFETEDGFCLVQEYKNARHCGGSYYTCEQVKKILLEILQILVYLQQPHLQVIHRDIKPENILVGEDMRVYLVDFGFARNNDRSCGASSIVKGTFGFMPPEQTLGRKLDFSADLYSLGITAVCLLTGTESKEVGELFDDRLVLNLKKNHQTINSDFLKWLETISQIERKKRFINANVAYKQLQSLDRNSFSGIQGNKKNSLIKLNLFSYFSSLLTKENDFVKTDLKSSLEKRSISIGQNIQRQESLARIIVFVMTISILGGSFFGSILNNLKDIRYSQEKFVYIEQIQQQGDQKFENQNYLEAISYYDRALDKVEDIMKTNLNPFNVSSRNYFLASTLLKKGNSYYYLKEYSEAIINYNRAIQINPEDAHLYFNRGLAYAKLQNTEAAFNDFDRAAKIDPEFTKAIDNREIIRQNLKK